MDSSICFLLTLLLVCITSCVQAKDTKNGFIFTMPKTLRQGTTSEYCLTLHGASQSSHAVSMSLINAKNGEAATKIDTVYNVGEQKCTKFPVPESGDYELLLYNETDILHDSVKVKVQDNKLITFVQTDKPQYKPGQKVKFRILTLLSDLRPRVGKIKSIFITDPNDMRVKQYLDVDTQGIASLEFQLASEAKLGHWKIEVIVDEADEKSRQITLGNFEVKEYVLPRFEVEITPPSYILADQEIIEGKVCAKYTYGKPVTGFLDLKACMGSSYRPSSNCIHQVVEMSGCYNFSLNATEMRSDMYYHYYGIELQLTASVTEAGTGAVVNKTHSGPKKSSTPLEIVMDDYTHGFFKPGLPFYGKAIVTKPDGTPASGETIRITAVDYENNIKYSSNFTTDDTGVVVYALCSSLIENSTAISIDAEATEYKEEIGRNKRSYFPGYGGPSMQTPRGYSRIRQWFSPSLSYIQIPRMDSSHKCGERLTLSIPFTTRENTETEFHYQVMARGKVIKTGQVSFDQTTSYPGMDLVQPPADICLQWEEIPTPPPPPTTPEPEGVTEEAEEEKEEETNDEEAEEEEKVEELESEPLPPSIYNRYEGPHQSVEPIVRSEFVSDTVSNFLLDLTITAIMSPKFTLLVYHVIPDGEVVADSMEFLVTPCFDNDVKMEFNTSKVLPGEDIDIKVEAAPGSVCGVGIVDKSVNILGGEHQVTPEKVFDKIEEFSDGSFGDTSMHYRSDEEYCEERMKSLEDDDDSENEKFYWHYRSEYVDAIQAFRASGFMVLSNLDLETRPCARNFPVYYDSYAFDNNEGVPGPVVVGARPPPLQQMSKSSLSPNVRSNFPETWLWDLQVVGETGETVIKETAPHTITSWVGNAMCLDQSKGFGISDMTSLTTFQPFFLSLHLPYAAVRGERLPILFTVYNYLEKCLHIQVSLELGDNFKIHHSKEHTVCVCGGDSHTVKFYATPEGIGNLPVYAKAEIVPGLCGNSVDMDTQYVGMADAVKRQMLVKAEGVEQQYSHSLYLCSKDGKPVRESVILPLPDEGDMVKDSARGEVKVIGDIMGPALNNLDHLVRMPTGCGEQNMVGFVPNIFVLKYLTNTGRLTEEIQADAVKYMEIGYQRELTYRHRDGSFSAFGTSDERGSVWLTAFVVKSFAQAQPYIYIEKKDMDLSLKFLRQSQLETGCFRETGKVFSSYMMGGLGQNKEDKEESLTALTAYVLIALLNAQVDTSEPVIEGAVKCIKRDFQTQQENMDVYSLALVSYAMSLYEPSSRSGFEMLKLLDSKAKRDGSLKYWGRESTKPEAVNTWYYYAAPSAEVEMTAYALMAYLGFYGKRGIEHSHDIAMWLSQQRNAYGGFSSTQDTVVGLNALSEFAGLAYSKDGTDLQIAVSGKRMDTSFSVSDRESNTLLLQTAPIPKLPNELTIRTTGAGCALIQSSVRYNKKPESIQGDGKASFNLKVTPKLYQHDIDRCDRKTIEIRVSATTNSFSTGMTLVTVRMVTGWTPILDSLIKLKSQSVRLGMKRYEHNEEEGLLTLYFDEIGKRAKMFSIDVEQDKDLRVSPTKPAEIKVYQYYETDVSVVQSYELKTICGTKEEIPRKNLELDPNLPFPVQVRVDLSGRVPASMAGDSEETCPVCIPIKQVPKNFKEIVCNSTAAYKAVAGRKGAKPVKLLQDLRPKRKVKRLNIFANYKMTPGCDCTMLDKPPKKVLILVREKVNDQMLKLDGTSVITLAHKGVMKGVRKIQKSCPLKNDDDS